MVGTGVLCATKSLIVAIRTSSPTAGIFQLFGMVLQMLQPIVGLRPSALATEKGCSRAAKAESGAITGSQPLTRQVNSMG